MIHDDELTREFVVECSGHLAEIEGQLLEIEAAGSNFDEELVNTVFRAIHSVKGAAGFLGFTKVNALAHSLENVLNKVRTRELGVNKALINALLSSSDKLRLLVENVETSNDANIDQWVKQLDAIDAGVSSKSGEVAKVETPSVKETAARQESSTLEELFEEGVKEQHAETSDATDSPANQVTALELDDCRAEAHENDDVDIGAVQNVLNDLQEIIEDGCSTIESGVLLEDKLDEEQIASMSDLQSNAWQNKSRASDSFVRVNVSVLDRLMNLAGELVLSRNQLLAAVGRGTREGLDVVTSRVDQLTSDLQETIMQTRMQPIGSVFSRFPRVVRDLCDKLGKQCLLEIEGNEVEVDKTIVEAMADPLTHLVRNSLDHGIELPEVRVAANKKSQGTVRLRAFHQAGKVCIRIEDDGAGMDSAKLKLKAIEKGLLTFEQASVMSESEALRLIFSPGLSTAAKLSDVSGRGVGMDVVKTNIEQLGGSVDVESVLGKGSAINITLPLTLAIVPSMIVGCEGERFAVPQANIAELVRVPISEMDEKIGIVHGAEVLRLRGMLLPLVRLSQALGIQSKEEELAENKRAACILVLETGQMRYGLLVDGLHDNEEIVVKPLGKHVRDLGAFAGATILGDGYVALILDVGGIALQCKLRSVDNAISMSGQSQLDNKEVHRLLLFENHSSEQFAIPMAMVARIEQIHCEDIQNLGGQNLLITQGKSMPVIRLEDAICAIPPDMDRDRQFVIVFRMHSQEIGLVAHALKDIQDVEMNIDARTLRTPGVLGVLVIDDVATRVLDVMELVESQGHTWFVEDRTYRGLEVDNTSTTVLLAEDSDFFRNHVTKTLEGGGFEVISTSDGLDAWECLTRRLDEIDIIVTDIEMPRMSGLELVEKVRSNEHTAALPVIALTSLAGDADRRRGISSGIDEYQIKMDAAQLIESVKRMSLSNKVKSF